METYLGLDLGGTKMLIVQMHRSGKIIIYNKYDSDYY